MARKLVIEITDDEGRVQLLKRRDGIAKFLDNMDSMFKRGSIVRAIKGVTMNFQDFVKDERGGVIPGTSIIALTPDEDIDLNDAVDVDAKLSDKLGMDEK